MKEKAVAVNHGLLDLVLQAGPLVQLVIFVLIFASVICWALIAYKFRLFRITKFEDSKFLAQFWNAKSLEEIYSQIDTQPASPIAAVFKSGYKELQKLSQVTKSSHDKIELENINRALNRMATSQTAALEKNLNILASTASAAPFIGLFGTVWGIMNSFQNIGASGSASLAVVAPGISEALIATAIGLAAAIPAAIAYNQFISRIKGVATEMECFIQDYLNIIQRGLMNEQTFSATAQDE